MNVSRHNSSISHRSFVDFDPVLFAYLAKIIVAGHFSVVLLLACNLPFD
jgi:hypothetical protein